MTIETRGVKDRFAGAPAMTRAVVAVALTLMARAAQAQVPQLALPPPAPIVLQAPAAFLSSMSRPMAPVLMPSSDLTHRRGTDVKFWLLGAALNTTMLLDTKSTFDVKRRCARCTESNPLVAPFINRGPGVAFVAAEAFDIGVLALAARMRKADRASVRRLWWVVPALLTVGHAVAYRHNLGVGRD